MSMKIQPIRWLVGGVCLSLAGGIAVAGAEDSSELVERQTWQVIAEARGVSHYTEIPSEQPGGGPFIHTELDPSAQYQALAEGFMGYPSRVVQEGAMGVKQKPSDVYATSRGAFPKSDQFAPAGDNGPGVKVETPDDLTATGSGAYRMFNAGDASSDASQSTASSYYDKGTNAMVAEAMTHAQGLKLSTAVMVQSFESWIKLTFPADGAEPKVDYRLTLTGINDQVDWSNRSDGYTGNKDVVVTGKGVGVGSFVQDFSTKASEQKLGDLMQGGIFVQKPRVSKTGDVWKVAGAALDLRSDNGPRQGTLGQATGIRFGDSAIEGYFHPTAG